MKRLLSLIKKVVLPAVALIIIVYLAAHVEIRGDHRGIFVLRGNADSPFRITDDVYHGEQERVLLSLPLSQHGGSHSAPANEDSEISLTYDWNEATGHGCIVNNYPNGTKLLTCFGRFIDGAGRVPSGLFVGGNPPFSLHAGHRTAPNATGMAFYDGARWNHIWCSVNEAFLTYEPQPLNVSPSRMKFLGSKILRATDRNMVIMSRHEVPLRETKLLMQRYAFFKAGDLHFVLVNKVTNIGRNDASFSYVYGDEPWVGYYGSSRGDVGWLKNRIVNEEGAFDTTVNSFAGMFDYGNPLMNEGHSYTWSANFIEWLGERPNVGFFSNKPGYFEETHQPLASDTRFIGLQWGPQLLPPGESKVYILAIGMAGRDSLSNFPVKPHVDFPYEAFREYVQ